MQQSSGQRRPSGRGVDVHLSAEVVLHLSAEMDAVNASVPGGAKMQSVCVRRGAEPGPELTCVFS